MQQPQRTIVCLALAGILCSALAVTAAQPETRDGGGRRGRQEKAGRATLDGERPRRGGGRGPAAILPPEAEAMRPLSAMLGRPTDRSVTLNLLSRDPLEVTVDYGIAPGPYEAHTDPAALPGGTPVEVTLDGLRPDTAYVYRLRSRRPGAAEFANGAECGFHTQRAAGGTFVFEVQGDSHPERSQQFDPTLYVQTLRAAAADQPDFYLTLGDDFSVDALGTPTAAAVNTLYHNQRLYLALVGQRAPVFLTNGNHEQAALCNLDGTPDNVAVWAQNARNRYFPQPAPDGFYTGDTERVAPIGLLRDYYAWTWGDALFVVLDPYWHSPQAVDNKLGARSKERDLWGITLGDTQYRWFERTLAESRATFTFVFAHHVMGTGRGGSERAGAYEWGDTSAEFARRRPGWERPIHQLMAGHGGTVFVQGHDHLFARQELDGVVYLTLPEPADPNYAMYNRDAFRSGDVLPNSGRVRVTVAPQKVTVEYVRSWLPKDATAGRADGEVACRFEVTAPAGRQGADTRITPAATGGQTR